MRKILKDFKEGKITLDECERKIKADKILELDNVAKFDKSRSSRAGFPEAVYGEGKTYDDLLAIINSYFKNNDDDLIITRLSNDRFLKLEDDLHYLVEKGYILDYNRRGNILVIKSKLKDIKPKAKIGIITAGTSDIGVAEEAKVIIQQGDCEAITSYDIGVAGIHRLFPQIAHMVEEGVSSIIVCAGMEGALPTVVAGLVDVPVIAVPTSIGYGVGQNGEVALNAMLQSCAPGIAVVNIDNGFGAAVFALTIVNGK